MKGSGIGTPATRAAIIERLLKVGYAQRRGKTLNATDKGVLLINVMPPEIASPEMTGRWELALHEITDGKQDAKRFMDGIRNMSRFLVEYARDTASAVTFPQDERRRRSTGKGTGSGYTRIIIEGTICPVCGKGRIQETPRAFSCTEQGCGCILWKDCLTRGGGPELTTKLVTMLLEKKQLQGSTGTILIQGRDIQFIPKGEETPALNRSMIWKK